MNKEVALSLIRKHGDSVVVTSTSEQVVTLDFKTKYIRKKKRPRSVRTPTDLLLWSWTQDKFIILDSGEVKEIISLQDELYLNTRPL